MYKRLIGYLQNMTLYKRIIFFITTIGFICFHFMLNRFSVLIGDIIGYSFVGYSFACTVFFIFKRDWFMTVIHAGVTLISLFSVFWFLLTL